MSAGRAGSLLDRFIQGTGANIALIFGISLPVVMGIGGIAIDAGVWTLQERELQVAADAAAVASAKELYLANMSTYHVDDVAKSIVKANLAGSFSKAPVGVSIKTDASKSADLSLGGSGAVLVSLTQERVSIFSELLFGDPGTMQVEAVANVLPGGRVCVIGLEEKLAGAISLERRARVTAENCSVYSNSKNKNGIKSKDSAVLHAELICSAGGIVGGKGNFEPEPLVDCPPLGDPLSSREAPPVGGCVANNLEIEDKSVTLEPGTYCGGIHVTDEARVTFRPGIYVIQGGPLWVEDEASIKGENVGFYFTGKGARLVFEAESSISLTAPRDGLMAGLLVFEDRDASANTKYHILSNDARMLLGTIYLPNGWLAVDANRPVADESAYTAIVAKKMSLSEGPNLVLNADYDGTDIPVPNGIGPVGGNIVLAR